MHPIPVYQPINVPFTCYGEHDSSYRIVVVLYCLCERGEEPVHDGSVDVRANISRPGAGNVLEERGLGFTVCVTC